MRRPLIFAFVAMLVVGSTPVAAAPPPHVSGSPTTAPLSIDLAEMTLTPDDLGVPGYGLEASESFGLDIYDASVQARLAKAGFVRGYQSQLAHGDATEVAMRVWSALNLFGDDAGAKSGYAFLATSKASEQTDVAGAPTVGDDSSYYAEEQTDGATGEKAESRFAIIRTGRIVTILVVQSSSQTPDVALVERLAQTLAKKIRDRLANPGPSLGLRVVRLRESATLSTFDGYWRLDGHDVPRFNMSDADTDAVMARFQDAAAVYAVEQRIVDEPSSPVVIWRVARFADETAAKNWADLYPTLLLDTGAVSLSQRKEGVITYGGSVTYTAYIPMDNGAAMHAVVIVAHFGALGVVLWVNAVSDAPFGPANELMQAEFDCVKESSPCPSVAVPEALKQLASGS
jgi:hypothetical protein